MNIGDIFNFLFIYPITNLLVALYKLLAYVGVPYALGFAIILLTIIIKLLLYPLASSQIRSMSKTQKIAPHLAALKEKHKDDKKRQQEEMMKLYKEHGINPATGCLPSLLQIPIVMSLYNVLTRVVAVNSLSAIQKLNEHLYSPSLHLTSVWQNTFFGIALATSPSKELSSHPYLLFIPLLTGALQLVYSKMMMPDTPPTPAKKDQKNDDFQTAFQTQSLFMFPIMIGFFSYSLPIGLSLYWNTFTIFGILQQYLLAGPGGLTLWLSRIRK